MADYIQLDVATLEKEVAALLIAQPEIADDQELMADTLEGETSLDAVATRIIKRIAYAEANATALKAIIDDMKERQARFKAQGDAMRGLLLRVLSIAGADKLALPIASVSVTKPRTSVVVVDSSELPQGTYKLERKPETAVIRDMLEAGEIIPGATLEMGVPSVTIRRK